MNKQWKEFKEKAGQLLNDGMTRAELASILDATPKQVVNWVVGSKRPSKTEAKKVIKRLDNYLKNVA